MSLLRSAVTGPSGKVSANRLVLVGTFTVTLGVWVFCAIAGRPVPEIPPGVLGVLGVAAAAKVGQRFGEKA